MNAKCTLVGLHHISEWYLIVKISRIMWYEWAFFSFKIGTGFFYSYNFNYNQPQQKQKNSITKKSTIFHSKEKLKHKHFDSFILQVFSFCIYNSISMENSNNIFHVIHAIWLMKNMFQIILEFSLHFPFRKFSSFSCILFMVYLIWIAKGFKFFGKNFWWTNWGVFVNYDQFSFYQFSLFNFPMKNADIEKNKYNFLTIIPRHSLHYSTCKW